MTTNTTLATTSTSTSTVELDGTTYGVATDTQHFRTRNGVKREDVQFQYPTVTQDTLNYLYSTKPEDIIEVLNDALLKQAKALFLENTDNWDYTPPLGTYSLGTIANALRTPRSYTRIMTNENISLFAAWYQKYAPIIWNVSEAAANNGKKLIESRFKSVLGKPEFMTVFIERFTNIEQEYLETMDEILLGVLDGFISLFEDSLNATKVSIDDI